MDQKTLTSVSNDEPVYNIGIVARMTGLTTATLRAWERRYNFLASQRTVGGHRLYSEKDVLRLRWVKARIDEGMQTAQAINALQRQEQGGDLALVEPFSAIQGSAPGEVGQHLPQAAERLLRALSERDLTAADGILGEALALSPPETVILEMISPVMREVGEAWENGQINIATEHLATNYLRQRLLMWMLSGPPPRQVSPIVMACAPGEWHEGSLLVLGVLLRRRGWPIAYLGQALPLPDLADIIRQLNPRLVMVVAMTEETAAALVEWPQYVKGNTGPNRLILGYGGRVFTLNPEWRSRVAGLFLGSTFQEGVDTVERCLRG